MSTPLQVTHIAEGVVGGLARAVRLAAAELPPRGISLRFLLSLERDPGFAIHVEAMREAGIGVDLVPMVRAVRPVKDLISYIRIRKILAQTHPSLVHTHASKAGILGRRAAAALRIPAVHTPHVFSFEWCWQTLKGRMYRALERRAAHWSQRILLLSDLQQELALEARITDVERMEVIPNGVDTDLFRPPREGERRAARAKFGLPQEVPVIGTAARLEPQKGLATFLDTCARIHDQIPEAHFLLAGTGSLEAEVGKGISARNLTERIHLLGDLEEMEEFYHSLNCFLLTSRWEGLPYTILEAQACTCPVVATRTFGSLSLIVENETGLLASQGEDAALAQAVLQVVNTPSLAEHLGAWGRESVLRNFTINRWADGLVEVYRDLLA